MEEEISLYEIVEKLWKGKWIIVGTTAVLVLLAIIYSFFIAQPTYKGDAKVAIHKVAAVPGDVQPYIDEIISPEMFQQTLLSTPVLEKVIEREGLNETTIESLQKKINVSLPDEENSPSPFITVSMEGNDREGIKSIIDTSILLTREELGNSINSRLGILAEQYELKLAEEDQNIEVAVQEFNELRAGEGLPTLLLFQQNISGGQFILDSNEELLNELKAFDKTNQVEYEKINKKINDATNLFNFYRSKYDEITSVSSMDLVEVNTNVLSEAFVPNQTVSPNKTMNLAISLVVGLMLGVFIVFVQAFLKDGKIKHEQTVKHQDFEA